MDIESIRTFCVLYETGSFTGTAKKMGITEATVSYRIKELEKYMGRELVIRKRDRTIDFTDRSRDLYDKFKETLSWIDRFRTNDLTTRPTGTIRISSGEVAGIYFLAPAVEEFKRRYPDIDVKLEFPGTVETFTKLRNKEVDLGFAASVSIKEFRSIINAHKVTPVIPLQLGVVAKTGHPILDQPRVRPEELKKYPFLARIHGSAIQAEIEKVFERAGIKMEDLNILYRLPNPSSIISAVTEGLGVSICSNIMAAKYVESGMVGFVPLVTDVKSSFYMIDRHNDSNEVVNVFKNFLLDYVKSNGKVLPLLS
ncbi:MAG TPA: LysR family transcriptional regulator [Thermoplasmataceae archaeon]|nr:LysR family transcriptional regulator [Thermoplasmatales archaeon AK]HLH85324.1 LysR family transcriptional regulator [Thermoplasmataceae archaeon]